MEEQQKATVYPNLSGVVKDRDVSTKGTGSFAADYVPWAKVAHYLHEHAPGWQPVARETEEGGMVHRAPDGSGYLLMAFRHLDHGLTTVVPHAIMDHRMLPIPGDKITARNVSDAFVRGMCKAAAMLFGLGWQLWSKDDPFERNEDDKPQEKPMPVSKGPAPYDSPQDAATALRSAKTAAGMGQVGARVRVSGFAAEEVQQLRELAAECKESIAEREAIKAEA